jgi:hypothetical protein
MARELETLAATLDAAVHGQQSESPLALAA